MNKDLHDLYGRTAQERAELKAMKERINLEARANWEDKKWRHDMAAEMTETIYMGFDHENLLALMTNVENAGFDDRVFVKEVRGLRAHWVARGGFIESSELNAEVFEVPRDTVGFGIDTFEDKILTNFAETQATLIRLGIQRLDSAINARFFSLLQAAVSPSSSSYISGAGLTLTSLNTAIREVADAQYMSGEVTIVGRRTMTDQIIDAIVGANSGAGFLVETNEQLLRTGVLGTYRGSRIITLTNWKDDESVPFFPANELWVIGRDASKFVFWGDLKFKEGDEDDNWYWHYKVRRDVGGIVHRPERVRRIVDTNIAATFGTGIGGDVLI